MVSDTGVESETAEPRALYEALSSAGEQLAMSLSEAVVTPAAKAQFERDRGHPLEQSLPDKSEEYTFERHGFSALVLPGERQVVNQAYRNRGLTAQSLAENPEAWSDIGRRAEQLWEDVFGEWDRMRQQPDHPGPCPLDADAIEESLASIADLRAATLDDASLDVVVAAARDSDFSFLADLFETSRDEIYAPGGTDLSALRSADEVHVPYNDGQIAVLRPTSQSRRDSTPTRGVIVGHDDTPVGVFAHAVDATNLSPSQQTTRDAIRDAMGFDREIDPYAPPADLAVGDDERIRIQGDLRVERAGDIDSFPAELARRTRLDMYREEVETRLDAGSLPAQQLRRRSDVTAGDVLTAEVTPAGTVSLDPVVSDRRVELLAYVELLLALEEPPAGAYDDYDDIEYVNDPRFGLFRQFAAAGMRESRDRAREEVRTALQHHLRGQRDRVEREARNRAAEAEAGIDVPQQVNLPIDNHMTFIAAGYAPAVDTEPVPVAVPGETTLHIVHDEHNTLTVQIRPGVYRFSLLPRGLQPPGERPTWPER